MSDLPDDDGDDWDRGADDAFTGSRAEHEADIRRRAATARRDRAAYEARCAAREVSAVRIPIIPATASIPDAAILWALALWRVFPCRPADEPDTDGIVRTKKAKTPRGKWQTIASSNPAVVRRMFKRSSDLIGVALPKGVLVVDIDHKPHLGHDAASALAALTQRFPELAKAPCTITGSGGYHLWLVCDPAADISQHKLSEFVDTRVGGKGYVIVPPSVRTDGGRYVFRDGVEAGRC